MRNDLMTGMVRALVAALALLASAGSQGSVVIVDRFGPGDAYDSGHGWSVGNSTFPPDFATAFFFSSGPTGGYVDQITIALFPFYGVNGGNNYRATVYTDAPDVDGEAIFQPTTAIESIAFQTANFNYTPQLLTLQASGATLLAPRTPYWLAIEPVNGSQAAWLWNNQGILGIRSHYDSPTNYNGWITYPNSTSSAFRITVNPAAVPIPGAMWMLGAALAILDLIRRRPAG